MYASDVRAKRAHDRSALRWRDKVKEHMEEGWYYMGNGCVVQWGSRDMEGFLSRSPGITRRGMKAIDRLIA